LPLSVARNGPDDDAARHGAAANAAGSRVGVGLGVGRGVAGPGLELGGSTVASDTWYSVGETDGSALAESAGLVAPGVAMK
jgi:hypothetical protein